MFQKTKIHIRQNGQGGPNVAGKWLNVTLLTANAGDLPYRDVVFPTSTPRGDDDPLTVFKAIESQLSGNVWWGRWRPGSNSVNFQADSDHTVGTAHRDSRYWVYNIKTYELHFVQRSMESGWPEKPGAPPTGYKVKYSTALELYGVTINGRGVQPAHADEGTGWVRIANRMLRPERIYWEKTIND